MYIFHYSSLLYSALFYTSCKYFILYDTACKPMMPQAASQRWKTLHLAWIVTVSTESKH